MNHRILTALAVAFLLGILYILSLNPMILVVAAVISVGSLGNLWKRFGKKATVTVVVRSMLLLLLFLLGTLHAKEQLRVRQTYETLIKEDIQAGGEIYKKELKNDQIIYYLKHTQLYCQEQIVSCNQILVYSKVDDISIGSFIYVKGKVKAFQSARNEGNFDEKAYYHSRKIEFRLMAESIIVQKEGKNRFKEFLRRIREQLGEVFRKAMPQKEAGILSVMVLGEKSMLDSEVKRLYQQAGISHILAISGLHVSILGMGLYKILKKLGWHGVLTGIICAVCVYSFGVLSGMEVSTMRAVIMFLMMMAGQCIGFAYDSVTALFVSVAVQLFENPFLVYNTGFLFSYFAVFGIVVVADVIKNSWKASRKGSLNSDRSEGGNQRAQQDRSEGKNQRKQQDQDRGKDGNQRDHQDGKGRLRQRNKKGVLLRLRNIVTDTIFASFCIQLTTLPLAVYYDYEFPLYGIFTNACILPFMGILLFLGIVGGFMGMFFLPCAIWILKPCGYLLALNELICNLFLQLPKAVWIVGKPKMWLMMGYYIILAVALFDMKSRKKPYAIGVVVASLGCILFLRKAPVFEISVLDVGQGDGIFMQSPGKGSFFIDGGSSDVSKVGEYRILPFLKSRGITAISGWFVSHGDQDHISGLMELLDLSYKIEYIILAQGMVEDDALDALLKAAKRTDTKIITLKQGESVESNGMSLKCLLPQEDHFSIDRNASSMVLKLTYEEFSALFTGDIGEQQEKELVQMEDLEELTFYKAAHHGSAASNSKVLLDAIRPKIIAISCSAKNTYGHPSPKAVERMVESGSLIYGTKDCGQIAVKITKEGVRLAKYVEE
ncbi:ComEC/Rec2 family competence protein [Lachnospiraceae bacterium ZAX-1]